MNGAARRKERADRFRDGPLFSVLADRTYRHLFLAQIVALVGTGLATVALGLLLSISPAKTRVPCSGRRSQSR